MSTLNGWLSLNWTTTTFVMYSVRMVSMSIMDVRDFTPLNASRRKFPVRKLFLQEKKAVKIKALEQEPKEKTFVVNKVNNNNNSGRKNLENSSKNILNNKNSDFCQNKTYAIAYSKPRIVSKAPILFTALRAEQRRKFENELKQKEIEKQHLKEMELRLLKQQEEREIATMRRALVHKAQPIRRYKQLPPIAKRRLTDPESPNLSFKRQRRF